MFLCPERQMPEEAVVARVRVVWCVGGSSKAGFKDM